jgi:uncharacterized protein YecE (DUF72 family)
MAAIDILNDYRARTATGRIYVGTSGWSYGHWGGVFYPDGLASDARLPYYAARFATVEVGRTFFSLPDAGVIERWRDTAPPGFTFTVRAPRAITHLRRLRRSDALLADFVTRVRGLGRALGPILFQLPEGLPRDTGLLRNFLDMLPRDLGYAFEFRDPTWFRDRVYDLLADREAAFCIYQLGDRETPPVVTAPFVYVRLHGLGAASAAPYGREGLRRWADSCRAWAADEFDVRVYFDNDLGGAAVRDAVTLRNLVGQRVAWGTSRAAGGDAGGSGDRLAG